MTAPEGETAKERRRQWIVGIAVVVALFSLIGNVFLTIDDIRTGNANRAALEQRDARIVQLEKQHGADIQNESQLLDGIKKADAYITRYVINLDNALNAICVKVGAGCSVSLPSSTSTTTTIPPHGTSGSASHSVAPAPTTTATTVRRPGHSGTARGHTAPHGHH